MTKISSEKAKKQSAMADMVRNSEGAALRYYVQLQRRTAFSMFFFIMPGVFVNLTALMVFILPCESGEKISLGISAMLAMMVFLMAMTENLPPTQTIPIAGTYYGTCIGVLTANIMASIVVLNIQYKGVWGFPVPNWMRIIMFDFLAKILFIAVPPRIKQTQVSPKEADATSRGVTGDQFSGRPRTGRAVRDDGFIKRPSQRELEELASKVLGPATTLQLLSDNGQLGANGSQSSSLREILERIELHLAAHSDQENTAELKSALGEEWRLVAYVVDRLSGIVFFIVTIIFNLVILLSSPEVSKFEYCRGPPGSCN